MGLVVVMYCMGRWQSENRAIVDQGLRAKEFIIALDQNRIEDIQFRLKDDLSVAAYNSYTPLSFGPDLWQKSLPKERISVSFEKSASAPKKHVPNQPTTLLIQPPPNPPTALNPEPTNQTQEPTEATTPVESTSSETKPSSTP